ncbi:protein chiffon isoform X2 [Cylas formicarius]|uniref:protein chiffon isoform X2 n=1 Tax=Cylas formicarius TaxID=197179 RepID=UPI002958B40D|nr:protein chiffon isoform X2 [Cylas formicarius]
MQLSSLNYVFYLEIYPSVWSFFIDNGKWVGLLLKVWCSNAMLESTKRKSDFEDIISEDYKFFSKSELSEKKSRFRCNQSHRNLNEQHNIPDDHNMTRKTRARRPRIQVLQSGYCAICNLPYNSVEDHIQSKKHQKLIGEDANYIALNGYIHSDVGLESLLSLTGIDAIGFDNDFSPTVKRRNMPKHKKSSNVSEARQSPIPAVRSETAGHHLRSRKNVNYMTPPLEEDSLTEKPDLEPPVRLVYKEYRELRSSTRALAKLTSVPIKEEPEVWNSGRPKRSCINRQKRVSADERLVADNKTYYKVEVLSNKLRSTDSKDRDSIKNTNTSKTESEKLIVKFKKLRNSELVQLNNEATNFLFPKKDESSDEENDGDEAWATSEDQNETRQSSITSDEDFKKPKNFKVEEESSMDSIVSETSKKKKRRRTHAEALINDNQKYYKFETPGSRLRYHGSYLSPVTLKSNGDCTVKVEPEEATIIKNESNVELNLDDYQFSFESVPQNQPWYQTFIRHDKMEQRYHFSPNYYWNDFVMPDKLPHLKALDPKVCIAAYRDLLKCIPTNEETETNDALACEAELKNTVIPPPEWELDDDNSKISSTTGSSSSSVGTSEQLVPLESRKSSKRKGLSPGKNPRKSPRQHASTLAILSLLHQRKRRSKNGLGETNLQTIPEEDPVQEQEKPPPPPPPVPPPSRSTSAVPKAPRTKKRSIDYFAVASKIDEELDSALDCDVDLELETNETCEDVIGSGKIGVMDILALYEESRRKESEYACRRFFNGTPGRKPGKRKKNKTGWPSPNKSKRRKQLKEDNDSAVESASVNQDSDEESESNDSITNISSKENESKRVPGLPVKVQRNEFKSKVLNTDLQPFVYVKKLDSERIADVKLKVSSKRTSKRQRRVLGSPKSPRMLRKPRGRWYRER